MTKFDRESFNLLKMTDSGSDSVPDLTFDLPKDIKQKKKVRLKRKDRKTRGSMGSAPAGLGPGWRCLPTVSRPLCLGWGWLPPVSSQGLLALVAALAVLAIVFIGLFTSNLHYKIQLLETQLKSKIVDDDAKSIPETLETLKNRLSLVETNQSSIATQLAGINKAISRLEARLDQVNSSLVSSGTSPSRLSQTVAELTQGIGELNIRIQGVGNSSQANSNTIGALADQFKALQPKVEIKEHSKDMVTEAGPPSPSYDHTNFNLLSSKIELLNSSVGEAARRIDSINATIASIEYNSSVRLDIQHRDVVDIKGMVSQLQDDNLNVSTSLRSLSLKADQCDHKLSSVIVNVTSLTSQLTQVRAAQNFHQHQQLINKQTEQTNIQAQPTQQPKVVKDQAEQSGDQQQEKRIDKKKASLQSDITSTPLANAITSSEPLKNRHPGVK